MPETDTKRLRAIGHTLRPLVTVSSKGLSANILAEIQRALHDHELIKVAVKMADREAKKATVAAICEHCGAQLVQTVGHIALLYKKAVEPNPRLSNILRNL